MSGVEEGSSWDADDFEPDLLSASKAAADKWEGEDEDDDVKDDWDKESCGGSSSSSSEDRPKIRAVQKKKKKKLADIIAEKELAKAAEVKKRLTAELAAKEAETPEGKAAEKLRLVKLEETENLNLAKEMLGLSSSSSHGLIDSFFPESKDDFSSFEKALINKISAFSSLDPYPDFIESLFKNLCLDLNAAALKKLKIVVETIYSSKLREEKAKNKKGGKKGGVLRMDLSKDLYADGNTGYDDMDDFM